MKVCPHVVKVGPFTTFRYIHGMSEWTKANCEGECWSSAVDARQLPEPAVYYKFEFELENDALLFTMRFGSNRT